MAAVASSDPATKIHDACDVLANALHEGRDPRVLPPAYVPAPEALVVDTLAVDVQTWLAGVSDDLTRLSAKTI